MIRYASRKFILAALALGSCTWLALEGVLTSGDFKTAIIGTVGAYIIGNVAQKAVNQYASEPAQPQ